MSDILTFERFAGGRWTAVASLALAGDAALGIAAPTTLAYVIDYAMDHFERRDAAALSVRLPVDLGTQRLPRWPAFLVDLLPQGYGRAELLRELRLPERAGREADWPLLCHGAGNPIGHLRVAEAHAWLAGRVAHAGVATQGFTFEEVAARSDIFIDFITSHGLFVAGSSGVQGEWPKILLTEDAAGLLHLDHALPDIQARRHWLVKFGRGNHPALAQILTLEAPYMELARLLGARVYAPLRLRERALFIPRFDRAVTTTGLQRIAQESIASLCGIAEFGAAPAHDEAIAQLARVCTDPPAEIAEYLRRDVLNLVLGNRDNHARNTAIQRFEDGRIALSPLFDFAPMMLHPDGIPRQMRWRNERSMSPDWNAVMEQCREVTGLALPDLPDVLLDLRERLDRLPQLAEEAGVPPAILDRQRLSISAVQAALAKL
jgi:serine/threonine-protein kinase HipA